MKKQTFYRMLSIALVAATIGSSSIGTVNANALADDTYDSTYQLLALDNTSYIESELIPFGSSVIMHGSATGGVGDCTYAYYYKQASADKWGGFGFTSETEKSFKPTKETTYNVCIKVKDSSGTVAVKYFDVEVKNDFVNTSTISAEKISLGEEIVMYGSATGGVGDYTYAYYYKQASADKWGGFGFGNETEKSFKPTKETTYNVCIKAKDGAGNIDVKYFDVEVENNFVNTSTISAESISLGEEIIMYGSATGGIGDCTYAYYYKQASAQSWGGFGFSSETEKSFKPTKETTYNICIKAKDSTGTVAVKYFDVVVKNNFVNTSTISAESISLGEDVVMYGSATGGIGDCTYAYYYKQASAQSWGGFGFSSETEKSFKPTKETTYNICIKVKDSAGKIAVQYFDVEVKNTLVNTSSVDTDKIAFGEIFTVKGSATGGSGQYMYQYLYRISAANWSIYEDYSQNAEIDFVPETSATYEIMVRVKDSNGITADSEIFTVEVENTFKNTSMVSAKSVILGEDVIMYGSAVGGMGNYTYAYYYKQADAAKWGGFSFSSAKSKSFKPIKETTYNVCIKVKDGSGTVDAKYFDVEVKNNIVNTSRMEKYTFSCGEPINLYGSATGGSGVYSYAFTYKQKDEENFKLIRNYGSESEETFRIRDEGDYIFRITVQDSNGVFADEKLFEVKVENTLINDSYVEAEAISKGQDLVMHGAAHGGSGEYTYKFFYKKPEDEKYNSKQALEDDETTAVIKPNTESVYNILIRVTDSYGKTVDKYIDVTVGTPITSTSSVNSYNIKIGNAVTVTCLGKYGSGKYEYKFLYGKVDESGDISLENMTVISDFSSTNSARAVLDEFGTYKVVSIVRDSNGSQDMKYHMIKVSELSNVSKLSKSLIERGASITIYGRSTGGKGTIKYAYQYKLVTDTSWKTLKGYSTKTSVSFTPTELGTYEIRILAKDELGTLVPKVVNLTVKKPKSEEITDAILPSILNDSMNDFEKVIAIHDWIVNNIEYDMEHYYDTVPPAWDSTAEGAYDNRKALCGGYAKLFRLLANTARFEVKIITGQAYGVSGTTEAHEWNRIKIGDNWYNVDVTMDDPVSTSTKINNLRYNYLLVPDSAISSTHFTDNTSESCTAPQPMDKIEPAIAANISRDTNRKTYICKTGSSINSAFKDASSNNLKQFQILYKSSETSASKISTLIRSYSTANAAITPSICTYAEGYWSIRVVFS